MIQRFTTPLIVLLAFCFTSGMYAQSEGELLEVPYDSVLAQQLGADDYGMKRYVMALLKAGPNRDHDAETVAALQRGHMDNMRRLSEEGLLVMAGPFFGGGELRGIFVFDVETVEEAEALAATDPAIQAGRLAIELYPWYGSATLLLLKDLHEKVQKKRI